MGGYPSTRRYVDTVQVYDAATDRWDLTTPLPQPMHHTMAAAVSGVLYVIGGEVSQSGLADTGVFLDTVYAFDPAAASWTPKASMPTSRSAGSADVINGKIYVAGGRPPHGHDFAVYDTAADTWQVLPTCQRSATIWPRRRWGDDCSWPAGASAVGWGSSCSALMRGSER
jgi:N-acetylneuraminic acid mutarotase